jgi:dTDP-4-amino-4,6-dideoxygalactose transaminase
MYQRRVAYGSKGYPFTSPWYEGHVDYGKGSCPVTERMHEKELFLHEMMRPGMTTADLDDVVKAFEKVWKNRQSLEGSP